MRLRGPQSRSGRFWRKERAFDPTGIRTLSRTVRNESQCSVFLHVIMLMRHVRVLSTGWLLGTPKFCTLLAEERMMTSYHKYVSCGACWSETWRLFLVAERGGGPWVLEFEIISLFCVVLSCVYLRKVILKVEVIEVENYIQSSLKFYSSTRMCEFLNKVWFNKCFLAYSGKKIC